MLQSNYWKWGDKMVKMSENRGVIPNFQQINPFAILGTFFVLLFSGILIFEIQSANFWSGVHLIKISIVYKSTAQLLNPQFV